MTLLFLPGVLGDPEVARIVAGRDVAGSQAELHDYAAHWVRDQTAPLLKHVLGATAHGLLIEANDEIMSRFTFYAEIFDCAQFMAPVESRSDTLDALVIAPTQTNQPPGPRFLLPDWQAAHGVLKRRAAREIMSYFGRMTPTEVRRRLSVIHDRAQAESNADRSSRPAPSGLTSKDIEIVERTRAYSRFYALDEIRLRHGLHDGAKSAELDREVFIAGDAVILLPYDPKLDRVLLVEQMRLGPIGRRDPGPWMLEAVAGRIDGGETPESTAHREALEEAGLSLSELIAVGDSYPSPGNSSEYHYFFIGLCDLSSKNGGGGLASEGEDIRSHIMGFDALMRLHDERQIANTPLAYAALLLARHRDRLRATA